MFIINNKSKFKYFHEKIMKYEIKNQHKYYLCSLIYYIRDSNSNKNLPKH